MSKIGKRIAQWIDSQTQFAQETGIAPSAISSYVTGKRQLPLYRFLQIVNTVKPPQDDVDDIFNFYLEDLGIPCNAIRLLCAGSEVPGSPIEGAVIRDARIAKIIELVMDSDIDSDAKVKVFNIIRSTKK